MTQMITLTLAEGTVPAGPTTATEIPESQIEPRFKLALDRYANEHVPTGNFLRAVLENRLMESWQRADDASRANLEWILGYLIWEMPGDCWGSPEIVAAWLKGGAS